MKLYVPVYGLPDDWGELMYYFPGRIYFKTREEAVQYLANNGYISKGQKLNGGEWSWDNNELEKFEYVKKPRWDSPFYVISEINEGDVENDDNEAMAVVEEFRDELEWFFSDFYPRFNRGEL